MMKIEFLKPNLLKVIIFIGLVIASFYFLQNLRIFPCKIQAIIPNPPPLKDTLCSPPTFRPLIGVRIVYSPITYVLYYSLLLALPYLLACLIGYLFEKRNR